MARVVVDVEEVDLEGNDGQLIPGITVTCSRCDHCVEVFGKSERSIRRGCVLLKEECPNNEDNWYTNDD